MSKGATKPEESKTTAAAMVVAYVVAVTAPIILATAVNGHGASEFADGLALHFGLLGFAVIATQFVTATRLPWLVKPFGLDMVLRFHMAMGVFVALMLVAHPLIFASEDGAWRLLYGLSMPWPIWVGRITLLLVLAMTILASFRKTFRMPRRVWLAIHSSLALLVLGGGFAHGLAIGPDLQPQAVSVRLAWAALFGLALAAYAYIRVNGALRERAKRRTEKRAKG